MSGKWLGCRINQLLKKNTWKASHQSFKTESSHWALSVSLHIVLSHSISFSTQIRWLCSLSNTLPVGKISPNPVFQSHPWVRLKGNHSTFSFHSYIELSFHDPHLAFCLFCKLLIKEPSSKMAKCVNCRRGTGTTVMENMGIQAT